MQWSVGPLLASRIHWCTCGDKSARGGNASTLAGHMQCLSSFYIAATQIGTCANKKICIAPTQIGTTLAGCNGLLTDEARYCMRDVNTRYRTVLYHTASVSYCII
jgi:hypothetical protein